MQISMSDYSLMPHEHFFSYIITIIQSSQFVTSFVVAEEILLFVQFSHVGFILEKIKRMLLYIFLYQQIKNICLHTNHYRMTFLQL